jgi:nucleotide-binding universal stress UspA family protein
MFKIKKILVPTDFSENAATAYNLAHKIAMRFKAKVDFIHVVQTMDYYHKSIAKLSVPLKTDEDLYPQLKQQASHKVKKLMDDYLKPENKGDAIVQIAPRPSKAIAGHAERGNYDLILMASLGEHDSNFLIGSVAEKVILYSTIPVLSTGKSNLDKIRQILVPTDGSEMSLRALPIAISMALTFDAGIILFHAQELYASLTEEVMKDSSKSDWENIRDAIYAKLEMYFIQSWDKVKLQRGEDFESQFVFYDGASSTTVNVNTVIERGISAHRAITEYASQNADMVVMGTHGRSGLAHVFLGSTAENVARHVTLPVVTVKPDFDEKPHVTE